MLIRPALASDAEAMLAIYAPIVTQTAISFELSPPSLDEFRGRIEKYGNGWAWLVAQADGEIAGYAYGSPHRDRPAYRFSTEVTVYVAPRAQGQGIGRALYESLLRVLADKGYCNAFAIIALPNPASIACHVAVGFRQIGVLPSVGRKFDRWHDVAWYHRRLRDEPPDGA